MNPNESDKKFESETLAYKQFMRVAKKISYLQYGKWKIVPNINDPMRLFTLEKDTGWFNLKVSLVMEQFYHRGDWSDNRYGYRARIAIGGLLKDMKSNRELSLNTNIKLKPRMAKKLLEAIDQVVIPKLYQEIDNEVKQRDVVVEVKKAFDVNISKVKGMTVAKQVNIWDHRKYGELPNCPFQISLDKDNVQLQSTMTYDAFADMAKQMGWSK